MKQFAIPALVAMGASAQWQWSTLDIEEDGNYKPTYVRTTPTSVFDVSGNKISIESNKAVFMMKENKADDASIYKPSILGGSVSFEADVSKIDRGCVAGLYLVKTGPECGQDERTGNPTCPSIDVMQANKWGFNMAAHPCANGNCDSASMCSYNMMNNGAKKYGPDAYGPGGSLINTFSPF